MLMENKEKVMDNYLLNLQFQVSSCIDLHYFVYYSFDLRCAMSGDWGGDVSWFVPPLSLFQLCQPDHKKQFIKKLLSNWVYWISKTKDKFLTTTVIVSFINDNMQCTYFNHWYWMVAKV